MKKVCEICGGEFEALRNQKYCSATCKRKAATATSMPTIKKHNKARLTINKTLLFAYDHKCAICGWSLPEFCNGRFEVQHGCQFHHIKPVSEGGTSDSKNVILLCPNHHKMAHAGLISREELSIYTFTDEEAAEREEKCRLQNNALELID